MFVRNDQLFDLFFISVCDIEKGTPDDGQERTGVHIFYSGLVFKSCKEGAFGAVKSLFVNAWERR